MISFLAELCLAGYEFSYCGYGEHEDRHQKAHSQLRPSCFMSLAVPLISSALQCDMINLT
jgi:hypothetical protein